MSKRDLFWITVTWRAVVWVAAGVVGASEVGYCHFNSKDCGDVVSRLSEIATEKKEGQQSVAELNEIVATASEVLLAATAEVEST